MFWMVCTRITISHLTLILVQTAEVWLAHFACARITILHALLILAQTADVQLAHLHKNNVFCARITYFAHLIFTRIIVTYGYQNEKSSPPRDNRTSNFPNGK